MTGRVFAVLMMVFAGVGVLIGTGIIVSDRSLLGLCQRGCWLNSLLFAAFGEVAGKVAYALIWYASAGLALYFSLRLLKKSRSERT